MDYREEISMSSFVGNTSNVVLNQPLPDREEERRSRMLIPISTIDWQSLPSTHFVPLSGLDFLTDVENLLIQQSVELSDGILKVSPRNQRLYSRENNVMEDEKQLQDYGLNSNTAKVQNPATVGLTVRDENGDFEPLELTPYSAPPDLPDVMKSQEINGQEQSS